MRTNQAETIPDGRVKVTGKDLATLTKARLSLLVVVTTIFGYLLARKGLSLEFVRLGHVVFGTVLAAFASAVFNQLMEMREDSRMDRTADRPLPAERIPPGLAFGIGWVLAAFGLVHLLLKVGLVPAILTAATIAVYIFVYTPLKRRSTSNTLVGAVSGALPPLIGWTAGGGALWSLESLFLFGLLFFWQLPHFLAINWMYREQYEKGGFVMWSNGDESGRFTANLALGFSLVMLLFMTLPFAGGFANGIYLIGALILTGYLAWLSFRFRRQPERSAARKLFFYTLIYLPLILTLTVFTWKR
ncbi:MAG: heme o synthase [Verrucomicrobiota bacterium]